MKKTKKTRFVYISTLKYCNVFVTQVVDWLLAYKEKGIDFEILRTSSLKKIISFDERKETNLIRKIYKGKVKKLYILPIRIFIGFIFDTLLLLLLFTPQLMLKKKILIQTRSADLWKPLKYLKKISPTRVKIIFDSRGAATEEIIYADGSNKKAEKKIRQMAINEKEMIKLSDKIFCVSNVLIDYHLTNNPQLDRSKFYPYPCSSNSANFFYSSELRTQIREQNHLETRKVIVYSGGLKLPWHIPSKIFELFAGLYNLDKNYFLILLSPDCEIAEQLLKKFRIPQESVLIISVDNSDVVKYLCASDIALLLRDDVPMNNVASPSKFAEYILTGLPVIISQNVGDFSAFVKECDLGYVFNNNFSENTLADVHDHFDKKIAQYALRRREIAQLGLKRYSKSTNVEAIMNQYQILIS